MTESDYEVSFDVSPPYWAFVTQLRAAILSGLETPAGVLGHQHGSRRRQKSVPNGFSGPSSLHTASKAS